MKRKTLSLVLVASALSAAASQSATLVAWDFSGLDWRAGQGSGLVTNDLAPNPLLAATDAHAAAGLTSSDLLPSTGVSPNGLRVVVTANTAAGEADLRDWDFGGNGSNENFMEFTLTADAPNTLTIDSISISLWRNGGGAPDGIAFDVNVDGGGFNLYGAIQQDTNAGDFGFDTFTFNETLAGATSAVIRFTPRAVAAGSTGDLHINALQVNGTVVPEPGSLALLGLGCLALVCRRRG